MVTKEDILLNILNRYKNIISVDKEFNDFQLGVIYKAMGECATIVNNLVIEDKQDSIKYIKNYKK